MTIFESHGGSPELSFDSMRTTVISEDPRLGASQTFEDPPRYAVPDPQYFANLPNGGDVRATIILDRSTLSKINSQ